MPMRVVVQPVSERVLRQSVQHGETVKRVVLERIKVDPPLTPQRTPKRKPAARGEWRIIIFLKGHADGITPALYRGGIRTFRTLEKVEEFGLRLMPRVAVETYDVFLHRVSETVHAAGESPGPSDQQDDPASPESLAA